MMLSENKDDIFSIKIRRKHIWEDSFNVFKRGVPVSKHLQITFLGEPAVDAGGPLREYFYLLLREIFTKGTLFQGKETARIPIHNVLELKKQTFKYIGNMLAASLLNGGPAPTFFADFVADYFVYGLEHVKVNIQDVLNDKMKEKLTKVKKCCIYTILFIFKYIVSSFAHIIKVTKSTKLKYWSMHFITQLFCLLISRCVLNEQQKPSLQTILHETQHYHKRALKGGEN